MNLNEFDVKFFGLKQADKIEMQCEHPECLVKNRLIGREAARRNIIKNGGTKFICGTCDKRFNNGMNKIGKGRINLGDINVKCPICENSRTMLSVSYFGPLMEPYVQVCKGCSQIGKIVSEEQKQKISDALSGRNLTEEHKEKIRKYMKENEEGIERGKKNLIPGMGGITRAGLPLPDSWKKAISEGNLNKPKTDEHKLNISEGRKKMLSESGGFSLEHRQKLRDAALRQYERGFDPHTHHRSGWHSSPKAGDVFHRSSYEKRAFITLDEMADVVTYEVETLRLQYWNPLEKAEATFIVDLNVTFNDGTKIAIEIKPTDWLSSLVNMAKIDALKAWSEKENCACEIWDEFTLFGDENTYKKVQQFIDWMDSGSVGSLENISEDVIGMRRAKSRIKANRYYNKKLSKKIVVYCDHCKIDHEVREITYNQHLEIYGKYICPSQNGKIGGSKPKKKKENPYDVDGKKQCNGCQEIKLFECFGIDGTKSDGYSTRCKLCRAKVATAKYQEKMRSIKHQVK